MCRYMGWSWGDLMGTPASVVERVMIRMREAAGIDEQPAQVRPEAPPDDDIRRKLAAQAQVL